MFLYLWGIGLRISEVCRLKGDAYFLQGRDPWIRVYQTKMKRYTQVPIPDAVYKLMKIYIKRTGIQSDEYVFQNRKGGAYLKNTFQKRIPAACDNIPGMEEKVHIQVTRLEAYNSDIFL